MRRIVARIWPHSQTWRATIVAALILLAIGAAFILLIDDWSDMGGVKDAAGAFQSGVTIVAIVAGGIFALFKLQAFRDFEPHLTVTHEVNHRMVSPSYLHIDVTAVLHNSSRVKVELREADFRLHQIAPQSDEGVESLYTEIFVDEKYTYLQWPTLYEVRPTWDKGVLIIEPGESHQETYDFLVSAVVESVGVYTYFYNLHFSDGSQVAEGWVARTVYDIVKQDS